MNPDRSSTQTHDRFSTIGSAYQLDHTAAQTLLDVGFVVLPGPVAASHLPRLAEAYDAAVATADPSDARIGRTSTRVNDLVNRGPEFDGLYLHPPVLSACCLLIRRPFKLSTMMARTVHPYAPRQALHTDYARDGDDWPMVGFILMVDAFGAANGATRFVPGSHRRDASRAEATAESGRDDEEQALACGSAGSVIVYNGSVRHGHTENRTGEPRRSIQGAYIRRDVAPAVDQMARLRAETRERIGGLARWVLAV
jgi:hypothetical protein